MIPVKYHEETRKFPIMVRSVADWIEATLQNQTLLSQMQFYPKCELVLCPNGSETCLFSESWTSENVWKIWVCEWS